MRIINHLLQPHKAMSAIGILIISMMALMMGAMVYSCTLSHDMAEKNAHKWAGQMKLSPEAIVCNSYDTDGDGYVSCSFSFGNNDVKQYECYGGPFGEGCRIPKINITNNGTNQ